MESRMMGIKISINKKCFELIAKLVIAFMLLIIENAVYTNLTASFFLLQHFRYL